MNRIIALAAATITTIAASSQTYLTIDTCRAMALEHNIAMRNADRDVLSAEQQKKEAFTSYFPTVSAAGMGAAMNNDLMEDLDAATIAGITAVQPVFAGGQILNSNKLAKKGLEAAQIQQEKQADEVALTAEKYFWNTVMLEEKLKTLDRLNAMLEQLNKDVTVAVNAGVSMRNDLLQVQLEQNDVESSRIDVRNGIRVSKMVLAQYIGLDDTAFVTISGINPDVLPDFPLNLKQNHEEALLNTTQYRLLEKNVETSELQRKLEVGKRLPSVAVGAGYTYLNTMDIDSWTGMLFATVTVPISDWWGGSHAIKRKKIAVETAREQLEDSSEQLMIAMESDWNDVEDAYKRLVIAKKSIEQSEENLRLNNDYYRAGTSQLSDLLDAQQYYQQARDQYVEAYAEYSIMITEYKIATGLY